MKKVVSHTFKGIFGVLKVEDGLVWEGWDAKPLPTLDVGRCGVPEEVTGVQEGRGQEHVQKASRPAWLGPELPRTRDKQKRTKNLAEILGPG